jgi:hypothetical protein
MVLEAIYHEAVSFNVELTGIKTESMKIKRTNDEMFRLLPDDLGRSEFANAFPVWPPSALAHKLVKILISGVMLTQEIQFADLARNILLISPVLHLLSLVYSNLRTLSDFSKVWRASGNASRIASEALRRRDDSQRLR